MFLQNIRNNFWKIRKGKWKGKRHKTWHHELDDNEKSHLLFLLSPRKFSQRHLIAKSCLRVCVCLFVDPALSTTKATVMKSDRYNHTYGNILSLRLLCINGIAEVATYKLTHRHHETWKREFSFAIGGSGRIGSEGIASALFCDLCQRLMR